MPLKIIKGPPNSGKTEELRRRYVESLSKRPVLVVPSTDDIFDWERRLMRDKGAFLGARIMHFKDLIAEVLETGPGERARLAGTLLRQALTRAAVGRAWPELKPRLARQRGLTDSLIDLFDELRAALIDPETLDTRLAGSDEADTFLGRVADTYRTYLELLAEASLTDLPQLAAEAVSVPPDQWAGRPVFVAGFDDLSIQQLDLLEALAKQTDVTIAIAHEVGNPAMAVAESLLGDLRSRGAVDAATMDRTGPGDHDSLLFDIERAFLRDGSEGTLQPGDALTIMRSSGLRGEAESVAAEIARLIDSGAAPGDIAVAVNMPSVNGGRFRDRLTEYGISATLESETAAPATATGRSLLAMLKASSPEGTADDFVRFLRGPVPVDQADVDSLERRILRDGITSVEDAVEALRDDLPPGWKELADSGTQASAAVASATRAMLEEILKREPDDGGRFGARTDSRIATATLRACDELDEILGRPAGSDEIADALLGGAIKTWSVPDPESVVIASPYRLRAKRFRYLFMVSLQERGMGDPDRSGPFLSPSARDAVELPRRQDEEDQERYLFYSCLSVPTARLWLSSRVADDEGKAEFPSPLVDAVVRLFDQTQAEIPVAKRSAADVLFDPPRAPSVDELARSLAASGHAAGGLELPKGVAESVEGRIRTATEAAERTRAIRSIRTDEAREVLGAMKSFGVTTLEAFTACPYGWFIDKAVRPSRFGPQPPYMSRGVLIHSVLEELFEGKGGLPGPGDLGDWLGDVEPTVERIAAERRVGLGGDSVGHKLTRTDARLAIESFIRAQSEVDHYDFHPWKQEVSFGTDEADTGPLEFDGWELAGKIDRIDVRKGQDPGDDGKGCQAVVIDYKSGKVVTRKTAEDEGKLQLPLYMLAARRIWKLDPVAGLYMPVSTKEWRPRGFVDEAFVGKESDPKALTGLRIFGKDKCEADELNVILAQAEADANEAVARIHAGEIDHDPEECRVHSKQACAPEANLWSEL